MSLEFGVLGRVEARVNGDRLNLGHRGPISVLAVLLLEVGLVVSADRLIDRVWGESAPLSVRNILYGYVSRLRSTLGRATGAEPPVRHEAEGYVIDISADVVDLHRFRRLVAEARSSTDDAMAAALLGEALALSRGPAFDGLRSSPWIQRLGETVDREVWNARLDRGDALLRLGQWAAMFDELSPLASEHSCDERLACQLMTVLYTMGQQSEAIACYHRLRGELAGELGLDPGPESQALYKRILRNDLAVGPGSDGVLSSKKPGDAMSVHATQTTQTTLGSGSLGDASPAELPQEVPGFTGRDDELAWLRATVLEQGARMDGHPVASLITGAPGIGKSGLAVSFARQAADNFPDGQLWIDLHGFDPHLPPRRSAQVLPRILRSFGLRPHQIPCDTDEQSALYRSLLARKRVLLVLDSAATAGQIRPLLPGHAGCHVVVTSRVRLSGLVAREGVRRIVLGTLAPADAVRLCANIIGWDRVAAEIDAASRLAQLCGYLPLALRTAAAYLAARPYLTLSAMADEFIQDHRRLDMLAFNDDDGGEVRAVFAQSYRALAPEPARMFRIVALHPEHEIAAHTAAALAATTVATARRLLNTLAQANLLEEKRRGRYLFHPLVHLYAMERARAEGDWEGPQAGDTALIPKCSLRLLLQRVAQALTA